MLKIGVTGSNGFIGWHLSSFLSLNKDKFEIIKFSRDYFSNLIKLDNFISNCDVLVHLAGINRHKNKKYIYSKNVELTDILISSFKRVNYSGKVIFSSSSHESNETSFGISKKECSSKFIKWANENNTTANCLIIPNVFGPFCKPNYNSVIATFSYNLINNLKVEIIDDQILKLIYVDDLIKEIVKFFSSKIIF